MILGGRGGVGAFNRLRISRGSPLALSDGLDKAHANWLREEVNSGRLRLPTMAETLFYGAGVLSP